jgi:hypothetical protein
LFVVEKDLSELGAKKKIFYSIEKIFLCGKCPECLEISKKQEDHQVQEDDESSILLASE